MHLTLEPDAQKALGDKFNLIYKTYDLKCGQLYDANRRAWQAHYDAGIPRATVMADMRDYFKAQLYKDGRIPAEGDGELQTKVDEEFKDLKVST